MVTCYITGNTYEHKEEIKKVKPTNKGFRNYWKYNYDFKCWELKLSNNFFTKKFEEEITIFCKNKGFKLEILNFTKKLTKSINDFKTIEEYFVYFHSKNNKNIKKR